MNDLSDSILLFAVVVVQKLIVAPCDRSLALEEVPRLLSLVCAVLLQVPGILRMGMPLICR